MAEVRLDGRRERAGRVRGGGYSVEGCELDGNEVVVFDASWWEKLGKTWLEQMCAQVLCCALLHVGLKVVHAD